MLLDSISIDHLGLSEDALCYEFSLSNKSKTDINDDDLFTDMNNEEIYCENTDA